MSNIPTKRVVFRFKNNLPWAITEINTEFDAYDFPDTEFNPSQLDKLVPINSNKTVEIELELRNGASYCWLIPTSKWKGNSAKYKVAMRDAWERKVNVPLSVETGMFAFQNAGNGQNTITLGPKLVPIEPVNHSEATASV